MLENKSSQDIMFIQQMNVFNRNPVAEVIGVVNIDGRYVNDGNVGTHTRIIMNEYKKYIDSVCN